MSKTTFTVNICTINGFQKTWLIYTIHHISKYFFKCTMWNDSDILDDAYIHEVSSIYCECSMSVPYLPSPHPYPQTDFVNTSPRKFLLMSDTRTVMHS